MSSAAPAKRSITYAGPGPGEDAAFWSEYDKLADSIDKDMIGALNANLDSLLIFAGLFSGVNSAALFYSIGGLSPNPIDDTNALLRLLITQSGNGTTPNSGLLAPPSQQSAPVRMNTFFAASLVTSLMAAFGAVLAKQWLLHYSQIGQVGELEKQCRKRQKKFAGAQRWHLRSVVEFLPAVLQFSLLAFFIGLIDFFWSINTTIAAVVISLFGVGLVAFFAFLVAGVIDRDCPFQTHATQLVQRTVRWTTDHYKKMVGEPLPKSQPKADPDQKKTEERAVLQRDCVLWTLEVADQKESLLEAARKIPSITLDACGEILKHSAYHRLLSQLYASLRRAKALGDLGKTSQSEAIVFGRALTWILLPTAADSEDRRRACDLLTRSWSGDVSSPIVGFEELALIAFSIDPHRQGLKGPPVDCSSIPPHSIPLYIICLVATDTSPATEVVIRSLISSCLNAAEIQIRYVLVSAWALKALANARRTGLHTGRSAIPALLDVYRNDPDVAVQVIQAIETLLPDSTLVSDRDFLEVVSMLITQLTKNTASYNSFTRPASQYRIIKAIEPLVQVKDPLPFLRTAAIKVLNALSHRCDLNFQMTPLFHVLRATVLTDICADMHANQRNATAMEFLKATSDFAIKIQPDTPEYQAFLPHSNHWLRKIVYLGLKKSPTLDVSQVTRESQDDSDRVIWPLALPFLQSVMERRELAGFWDAETICRVLSCYPSLPSDEGSMSAATAGNLMLPMLQIWSQSEAGGGIINRKVLKEHPEAVKTIVTWMKAQPEDLWLDSLEIVDHWSRNWFDHDEEEIHTLFMKAEFAEAVVSPWKSGTSTRLGAYEARDRIVAILSQKPTWREDLILAFNRVTETDGRLGGVKKVHKSLEREMIWRIASIVAEMPQLDAEPVSSAVEHLVPLLGHLRLPENPEEDRKWLKCFPKTVELLLFALRQSDSIRDHALETLANKSPIWFGHGEEELHQIFIDRDMTQALVECLYHESRIDEQSHFDKRDKILNVLLRSPSWNSSFHRSVVLKEEESGFGALFSGNKWRNVAMRARAVMDFHRLLLKVRREEGLDVVVDPWMSDAALDVVIRHCERIELKGANRQRCLGFTQAVLEHRAPESLQSTSGGRPIDSGHEEGSLALATLRELYDKLVSAEE
ncbi:hypothetical protein FRB93_006572 [Tulasnella sp. JGI-2019a]|nr:hypothetical protein FRB93_006572 [Tulasnella sp. JGI-2019a]